jgi:S1-C subfamily serine protease
MSVRGSRLLLLAFVATLPFADVSAQAAPVPPPRIELTRLTENYAASHKVEVSDDGLRWGHGSGSVIWREGYVLTNSHVVRDARSIVIRLRQQDGTVAPVSATLVAEDRLHDLAVIKLPVRFSQEVVFASVAEITPAMRVYNVGFPYQAGKTIDRGYVKQLDLHPDPRNPSRSVAPRIHLEIPNGHGTSGSGIFSEETGHQIAAMMAYVRHGDMRSPMYTRITVPVTVIRAFLDKHRIPYRAVDRQNDPLPMRDGSLR